MEENFINKAKIIINELNKADEMPSTVGWNDKRVSSKKEEKHYENTREGEILEKIDETSDISKRKEFINELREVRIQKKVILKNELNAELDSVKEKLNKESERLDRKIQKAKDLNKRVKRAIANNNALLKNRDENSLVYKAAKEENEKAMERKNKMVTTGSTLCAACFFHFAIFFHIGLYFDCIFFISFQKSASLVRPYLSAALFASVCANS